MRLALVIFACALAVTGCSLGGDNDGQGSSSDGSGTATQTPAGQGGGPVKSKQGVRAFDSSKAEQGPYRPSLRVEPGDVVQLETVVTSSAKSGSTLEITLPKGPGTLLRAEARSNDGTRSSTSTIRSADGQEIGLTLGRSCVIGATKYCDSEKASQNDEKFVVTVTDPLPSRPIVLSADVIAAE